MYLRILIALAALAIASPALASTTSGSYEMTNSGHYRWTPQTEVRTTERHHAVRHYRRHHRPDLDANGDVSKRTSTVVRSKKTGATAYVAAKFQPAAQALVDDLEDNYGSTIYFMGGWRAGTCSNGSQHPCGWALDICQLTRGLVAEGQIWGKQGHRWPDCKLPSPALLHKLVRDHGLYDGSVWGDTDYGHVQLVSSGSKHEPSGLGQRFATMTGKMVTAKTNVEALAWSPKPEVKVIVDRDEASAKTRRVRVAEKKPRHRRYAHHHRRYYASAG